MRLSNAEVWIKALGWLSAMLFIIVVDADSLGPDEACMDFRADGVQPSAWTLADCTEVWTQFVGTIPLNQRRRQNYADGWREITTVLRLAGSPCLCGSHGGGDGVGSMTMRIISSWIFSEEMGCDWVTPKWNRPHVNGENGTVLYCHRTAPIGELNDPTISKVAIEENNHCSVVDWLAYFQFNLPSVNLPEGENIKSIEVDGESVKELEVAKWSADSKNTTDQGWDRILFSTNVNFATRSLTAIANWDNDRREIVRNVMAQARHNFHVHPRPWYDENLECDYHPDRLNFALHVRMGDRRHYFRDGESEQYFLLLELFMDTVSQEVVRKGLDPPMFHVFSETYAPCPSEDTGIFDEFPSWPLHQVEECLMAEAPDDCPEKQAGIRCSPDRPGVFKVIEKPIVLHVGPDVPKAISCMILADGVLMGCSTFGQVAGLFSKGISFFSMQCSGEVTPNHYKVIPPIAVSERGYLWVPVTGSWHDPVIYSTEALICALDALLEK